MRSPKGCYSTKRTSQSPLRAQRRLSRRQLPLAFGAVLLAGAGCATPAGTIGAILGRRRDGRVFIRDAPAELASQRAGLIAGDEILLIDGQDVRFMDDQELHRALSGEPGTRVKLTLIRGDRVLRVTLERTEPTKYQGRLRSDSPPSRRKAP